MRTMRFHQGVIATSLAVMVGATLALAATTLDQTGSDGGQLRLLIGAVTGLALLILANFAIIDDEPG